MTKKPKKYYSAPIVNSIRLDSEICLILMTSPPADPSTIMVAPPSTYSAPPSASSTPFGGNGPDYSDM